MQSSLEYGGIYYVKKRIDKTTKRPIFQPAVVVSNVVPTKNSGIVAIVYLIDYVDDMLPTHIAIHSSGRPSTALCERITTIDISKFGTRLGSITKAEMIEVHKGIANHLQMNSHSGKAEKLVELDLLNTDLYSNLERMDVE